MKKHFPIGTLTLFLAFISIVALVMVLLSTHTSKNTAELSGVLRASAAPLRPFGLHDQYGKDFTLSNLEGRWTLLFFGYTFCPDICPTTLSLMGSLVDELRAETQPSQDLQVVFVTVDPQRDTPETLAAYLSYFRDDFVGITGEQNEILGFAGQFGAMFFKQEPADSKNYLMNHVSSIFLISPDTELIASFSPPHRRETIFSQFRAILSQF